VNPAKSHSSRAEASSTDVEMPKPGKNEVLIDVHAAGLNFFE
jgi:NADPH:quinone reductase-like Zn-dependent oxidoreductase